MIDSFITPEMLNDYVILLTLILAFVQFTKEFGWIKKIPTRAYSAAVAFLFVFYRYWLAGELQAAHIPIYLLTAVIISANTNGIYDLATKGLPKN